MMVCSLEAVSYTHLEVYKRQVLGHGGLVQGRNIAIHQVVDGIIPECVLAAVGLDLSLSLIHI